MKYGTKIACNRGDMVECCCEGVEQLAGMSLQNPVRLDATQQVCLSLTQNDCCCVISQQSYDYH